MERLKSMLQKNKTIILFILLGVLIRLIYSFFVTYFYDYFNILALSKSIADTGQLTPGFLRTGDIQLYGKIYYQIIAVWMKFLQLIHIIDIRYIFDTKAYNGSNYIPGLFQFSPPLYELVAIKWIQFLFDGILIYYLYKSARLINPLLAPYVVLFWALNPFFIFTAYAQMQSDLAMLSFLTAGCYYCLKAYGEEAKKLNTNILIALGFLVIGAIIKQVPLLLIPFVLILFVRNIKQLIVYLISTILFYILISQPWSPDVTIIKHFYIYSREALALFKFGLNGVPFFFFSYFALLIGVFIYKHEILQRHSSFLKVILLFIVSIYLSDETGSYFYQFTIWIMPFLALLSLQEPIYALFFLAPVIGFFKRFHIDTSLLTSSLGMSLSPHLMEVPDYRTLLQNVFPPILLDYLFQSMMVVAYLFILLYMFVDTARQTIQERLKNWMPYFSLKNLAVTIFCLYSLLLIVDFAIRSHYVLFDSEAYVATDTKIMLNKKPLSVEVQNPNKRKISAIEMTMSIDKIVNEDYLIIEIDDADTKKVITKQIMNDLLIPVNQEDQKTVTIFLKKTFNSPHFFVKLYKKDGTNRVYVYEAKQTSSQGKIEQGMFSIYLAPESKDMISKRYPKQIFTLDFRGNLPLQNIYYTLKHNISMKRSFYALLTLLVIIVSLMLAFLKFGNRFFYNGKRETSS